jgi:hypothetical protein
MPYRQVEPRLEVNMANKKKDDIPLLKVRKGATLREIYKRAREEFTAADLQKYAEIEETVPMEQVIRELEEIHRKESQRKKRKK